jgi:HlyD family secretion protein
MFKIFFESMLRHKIRAGLIIIALIAGGYYSYGKIFPGTVATQYMTAAVQKGTLIVSVSGSGQISALDQVDIKAKTSGDVVYVGVKAGQEVKAGTLLVQIDTRDAAKAVRNAEIALDSAKLNLEKMKGFTTDEGSIRGIKEKAQNDLDKAYDDGFNTVSNAFLDFPGIMSGLNDLLYGSDKNLVGNSNQWNIDYYVDAVKSAVKYDETISSKVSQYRDDANDKYQAAREAYDQAFSDYKSASRYSDDATIDNLINETYETAKTIAEATKSANNLIQFYKDKLAERSVRSNSVADSHLSSLNSYTSKTNSYLLSLLSAKNTIQTDKENLIGTAFDISDQEIKVSQAKNTLTEAQETLADCYIRAPFDGIIAKVNVKKGDTVSGAVATIITKQRMAEISLNEVDVAKVKVGQKVTLTFDAIEDLSISGEVAEVDTIGTVTQGVVNYAVKIVFDTQDERVKPGMSVSAAIITDMKQDVLMVSNSAVKSNGNGDYVEVMADDDSSKIQPVEIGLSNDTMTEIVNGLNESDKVVTQTITANATAANTQTSSQSRGGGFMMMGR